MEKFNSINRFYFRETHVAIVVDDVTEEVSFSRTQFWGNELDQYQQDKKDDNDDEDSENE